MPDPLQYQTFAVPSREVMRSPLPPPVNIQQAGFDHLTNICANILGSSGAIGLVFGSIVVHSQFTCGMICIVYGGSCASCSAVYKIKRHCSRLNEPQNSSSMI